MSTNNDSGLNLDHLEALAPCPFCGNDAQISGNGQSNFGYCPECETEGPPDATPAAARDVWNRRAAPVSEPIAGDAIKPWQQRLNDSGQWPVSSSWVRAAHMEAEIADLRAALANQPAPAVPLDADELTRLRRLMAALGHADAFELSDDYVRGVMCTVLAQAAGKLERAAVAAVLAHQPAQEQAEPLSEAQLDRIARSYFSEQWAVAHAKDAIHDAFMEAGRASQAAQHEADDEGDNPLYPVLTLALGALAMHDMDEAKKIGTHARAALAASPVVRAQSEVSALTATHGPLHLTNRKTEDIAGRGYNIVGYVLRRADGEEVCISAESAVRWLPQAHYQRLMHEQDGSLFAEQAHAGADEADARRYRALRDMMRFSTAPGESTEMELSSPLPAVEHDVHNDWYDSRFCASVDRTVDAAIRAAQEGGAA